MIEKGVSIGLVLLAALASAASGQEGSFPATGADSPPRQPASAIASRWPKPTLGGSQFWGDVYIFHDWRIQQRAGEDRHRLLSPGEFCHAEGSYGQCRARLEQIKLEEKLEPMRGRAVILLARACGDALDHAAAGRSPGREGPVHDRQRRISEHASDDGRPRRGPWRGWWKGLPEVTELNFVGHSMGEHRHPALPGGHAEAVWPAGSAICGGW